MGDQLTFYPPGIQGVLARATDPATSHEAAAKAAPDEKVGQVVARVMRDGKPRIDEEIYVAYEILAYWNTRVRSLWTTARIRHGRLWCERRGLIVETGKKRKTSSGGMSREWVWA